MMHYFRNIMITDSDQTVGALESVVGMGGLQSLGGGKLQWGGLGPLSKLRDLNNYRPISLLSIFVKIIEKMMHIRLQFPART